MKSLSDIMSKYYSSLDIKNIDDLRSKTILITGASGLIGSNLIALLDHINTKHNCNLTIIGVVRSGVEKWMPTSPAITYLQKDLTKETLDINQKVNFIFHCATYGQPKKFLEHPDETVQLNISVLFDLLRYAETCSAKFIYLSSAEIYGEADEAHQPTEETYFGNVNTLSERAIYAESKRLAETICFLYSKKVDIKIGRLLICYGPGVKLDDRRVYSEFIKRALSTGEITMMDEGTAQRSLCFVADAVEMLLNISLKSKEFVYNICGSNSCSIRDLAEVIAKINNATFKGTAQKREITGTPQRSTLSNKRYISEFNKERFISLEDGMTATSEWFKNLQTEA